MRPKARRWNYLLFLLVNIFWITKGSKGFVGNATCGRKYAKQNRQILDVFWVNLDRSAERKEYMTKILSFFGFSNHRVSAFTPDHISLPKTLEKATDCRVLSENETRTEIERIKELQHRHQLNRTALIAGHCGKSKNNYQVFPMVTTLSHLFAIYQSIHHHSHSYTASDPHSYPEISKSTRLLASQLKKYALIMEDDLQLAFEVDFTQLIATAPEDFVMLQLATSNVVSLEYAWERYMKNGDRWLKRGEYDASWWAGAYLINKERLQEAIDSIITRETERLFLIRLQAVDKKCPQIPSCCNNTNNFPAPPCVLSPYGYEADNFIYNIVFGHTYVSTIPFFISSDLGEQSTLHPEHNAHVPAFTMIRNLIQYMLVTEPKLFPHYANAECAQECHKLSRFCLNQSITAV